MRYFIIFLKFFIEKFLGGKEEKVSTKNKKNDRRYLFTQKKYKN